MSKPNFSINIVIRKDENVHDSFEVEVDMPSEEVAISTFNMLVKFLENAFGRDKIDSRGGD